MQPGQGACNVVRASTCAATLGLHAHPLLLPVQATPPPLATSPHLGRRASPCTCAGRGAPAATPGCAAEAPRHARQTWAPHGASCAAGRQRWWLRRAPPAGTRGGKGGQQTRDLDMRVQAAGGAQSCCCCGAASNRTARRCRRPTALLTGACFTKSRSCATVAPISLRASVCRAGAR